MESRMIRLRRPVTLSVMDGPHVPDGEEGLLNEVERRWKALCDSNPAYFDGRLLHVIGVHRNGYGGAVLHVIDCAYRFHAVQDHEFDLGIRPLGVKGITMHNDQALLGKRSQRVAAYRGLWEFAPGGVVEPGADPVSTVRQELTEETSLCCASEPIALAVIFDTVIRTWEIAYRLDVRDASTMQKSDEYDELRWCDMDAIPPMDQLSPIAQQMVGLIAGIGRPVR
jgi:ADP-ribose pyrophosphatase YjhB (NUDIX family)